MTTPAGPGGYPPPGNYPPPGSFPPPGGMPTDHSGKARNALILSILGLCCFICPIIGIILGLQAQNEMKASGNTNGLGMAQAAVWVGIVMLVLAVLGIALRFTMFTHGFGGR